MPQGGAEVVDPGRELALDLPRARDDEREKRETRLHNRSFIDMEGVDGSDPSEGSAKTPSIDLGAEDVNRHPGGTDL
jgi:hypothetical protein